MKKVISSVSILLFGLLIFAYHHSDINERMSSVYAQGEDPWSIYIYNDLIVQYPSNWQADSTNPDQVAFHGSNTTDGTITIGVLGVPIESGANLSDAANQLYGSKVGTNLIQEFSPTRVGGHEAASGIVSNENGTIQSKITMIRYDSNTLYMLQFLSAKESFGSNENNQIMNRAIASVSFVNSD
jgi:hypothetical protein